MAWIRDPDHGEERGRDGRWLRWVWKYLPSGDHVFSLSHFSCFWSPFIFLAKKIKAKKRKPRPRNKRNERKDVVQDLSCKDLAFS
jgi:hypothetical protein